jgi:hypothetical protein
MNAWWAQIRSLRDQVEGGADDAVGVDAVVLVQVLDRPGLAALLELAFITGDGVPFPTVESGADPAPDGPATFPTGWFSTREAAYQWLAATPDPA